MRAIVLALLVALALAMSPRVAQAQDAPPESAASRILADIQSWGTVITQRTQLVNQDPRYMRWSGNLFQFFGVMLLIRWGIRAASTGVMPALPDLVERVTLLIIVAVLMSSYNTWTLMMQKSFDGLRDLIQSNLWGSSDTFAPMFGLIRAAESVTFESSVPFLDWLAYIPLIIATIGSVLLIALLIIATAAAHMWAFWGYTVLKLIGLFFIPFLLFDKLSAWFDGWFNLFAGFALYSALVSIGVNIAALALQAAMGIPLGTLNPESQTIVIANWLQTVPLMAFATVCAYGIWRSYAIAGAIVGSNAISAQVRGAATFVAGAFR